MKELGQGLRDRLCDYRAAIADIGAEIRPTLNLLRKEPDPLRQARLELLDAIDYKLQQHTNHEFYESQLSEEWIGELKGAFLPEGEDVVSAKVNFGKVDYPFVPTSRRGLGRIFPETPHLRTQISVKFLIKHGVYLISLFPDMPNRDVIVERNVFGKDMTTHRRLATEQDYALFQELVQNVQH